MTQFYTSRAENSPGFPDRCRWPQIERATCWHIQGPPTGRCNRQNSHHTRTSIVSSCLLQYRHGRQKAAAPQSPTWTFLKARKQGIDRQRAL